MGTQFQIILYARDAATAARASHAAFQRIEALNDALSDYKADSELMQLCRKAGGDPIHVSAELFQVLAQAQEISRLSNGAFDVTVGPVSRLWRRARKNHELPKAKELADARTLVGYKNMVLDAERHTVHLLKPRMSLDLGGIGKGFAADEAQHVLRTHGITSALVAAGGDIVVSGSPPNAPGWTIRIASLDESKDEHPEYIILKDAAVSTSGDREQYIEIDGKRYSHLIDPRTGIGLTDRIAVTVIAPKGIIADPLTKAVSIMGARNGAALIDGMKATAARIQQQQDRGIVTMAVNGFDQFRKRN
jgi:thiamine biosynthesis lipoprotein